MAHVTYSLGKQCTASILSTFRKSKPYDSAWSFDLTDANDDDDDDLTEY